MQKKTLPKQKTYEVDGYIVIGDDLPDDNAQNASTSYPSDGLSVYKRNIHDYDIPENTSSSTNDTENHGLLTIGVNLPDDNPELSSSSKNGTDDHGLFTIDVNLPDEDSPELSPSSMDDTDNHGFFTIDVNLTDEVTPAVEPKTLSVERTCHTQADLSGDNLNLCQDDENDGVSYRTSGVTTGKIPLDYLATQAFITNYRVLCANNRILIYNSRFGCYEDYLTNEIYIKIRSSLPEELDIRITKSQLDGVIHRILSNPDLQIHADQLDSSIHLINFRNKVLDVETGELYSHSHKFCFNSFINARYHRKKSGKRNLESSVYFKIFLEDCTDGDVLKMKSLQEVTGYIISNEFRAKKFFALIGQPHSGKSIWLAIWKHLIGSKHTTSMSLNQIGSNRFMTAELAQSKLNISGELDENRSLKATDIIKQITGNDMITSEMKGKSPFHFQARTKLVVAGNAMPLVQKIDGTTAFTDRILFLLFNHTVPEKQRDKNLLDKLLSEIDIIACWAVEGLMRLRQNNFIFTESEDALLFKHQYSSELNNVPSFLNSNCTINTSNHDLKVHRVPLFQAYQQFCSENGHRILSKQEFYREIAKTGVTSSKFRINGSKPLDGYKGIMLIN